MSVVRKHFCAVVARVRSFLRPRKYGLKGTMPAELNISVASPCGTMGNDGLGVWPFLTK
jgi:hypothetical protein